MRAWRAAPGLRVGVLSLGVLSLGGLSACGGGADASGLGSPAAEVEGARGRRCSFVAQPEAMPSFEELVRIGTRGSLSLWGRGAGAGDSLELSIRYDDEGRLAWVRTLDATVTADRVAELERLIRSAVEENGPEDWGVRIRFVGGAVETVLPSVICDPVRTSTAQVMSAPVGTSREMAELYSALRRRFTVRVALDERGRVLDARLPHSTGSRLLDQYVIDVARSSQYDPKLHDGVGIPSILDITVRYRRRI